jgi:hypothetical protein
MRRMDDLEVSRPLSSPVVAYKVKGAVGVVARRPIRTLEPSCGWSRRICRAALGEERLRVSIAEREAQVEPHSMLDDIRWKAVAAV